MKKLFATTIMATILLTGCSAAVEPVLPATEVEAPVEYGEPAPEPVVEEIAPVVEEVAPVVEAVAPVVEEVHETAAYFENCSDVKAAGAAPIAFGDPGWDSKFDRDGDGVGCES